MVIYLGLTVADVQAQNGLSKPARTGAGEGKNIPAYLLSDLPNLTAPYPDNFMLVDSGREGLFRLDNNDTATPDNRGTVLVTGNKRYKRAYKGMIEVEWFGAKGNSDRSDASASANTLAIQAACDWAGGSSGGINDQTLTPANKDRPAVVHIPAGTYFTSGTINLHGAINVRGDGGMSFGGTVLYTKNPGYHLFTLAGALGTGISNAVEIHDMRILLTSSSTESAAIYSGNPPGASFHSLRVEGVWFQLEGETQRIYIGKSADDVKFTNCTFDGNITATPFILGTTNPAEKIANFAITNCTGYYNYAGLIKAVNVDGLLFANNRIYGAVIKNITYQTPFVIDALTNSIRAERIQIIGNSFDRTNRILMTKWGGALVIGNTARNCTGRMIEIWFKSNNKRWTI